MMKQRKEHEKKDNKKRLAEEKKGELLCCELDKICFFFIFAFLTQWINIRVILFTEYFNAQ